MSPDNETEYMKGKSMHKATFRNIQAASAGTIATLTGETSYSRQDQFLNWVYRQMDVLPEEKTWMETAKTAWKKFEKLKTVASDA